VLFREITANTALSALSPHKMTIWITVSGCRNCHCAEVLMRAVTSCHPALLFKSTSLRQKTFLFYLTGYLIPYTQSTWSEFKDFETNTQIYYKTSMQTHCTCNEILSGDQRCYFRRFGDCLWVHRQGVMSFMTRLIAQSPYKLQIVYHTSFIR